MKRLFYLLITIILLNSCTEQSIETFPTFSENGHINVIIEIPSGTNRKVEYDYASKTFAVEEINGKERVIDFLGYPGNYGFVPQTRLTKSKGGDGDAFDAIVIGASLPTSSIIEVIPLGILMLNDNGETDHKLICIPAKVKYQTIKAKTLSDLKFDYPAIPGILEIWFENYKGFGRANTLGWLDEQKAIEEIKKWAKES